MVGTNSLNDTSLPLLDIVDTYEKVVEELVSIFPNSRIGLYNVLPRECPDAVSDRISKFNQLVSDKMVPSFRNVYWIQYITFMIF